MVQIPILHVFGVWRVLNAVEDCGICVYVYLCMTHVHFLDKEQQKTLVSRNSWFLSMIK